MGRIADALKRAEQERREKSRGRGGVGTLAPPEPGDVALASESSVPGTAIDDALASARVEVREAAAPVAGLSESLVPFYERSALVTEQYRSLRTRLLSQNLDNEHRIIAITSAVPKEGKSVTTLNLGCILAEIRHLKVCVVDGDFRRSSLAHMLSQSTGPGLADVLAGQAAYENVLRDTMIPNLKFMPAGSTKGRSAAELLTSSSASPIFRRMQREFHYTIVDTPPTTTVTDVGIIGQMCHGVIMIVRLHRTHEAAAKRAVRLLQVNNIPILGCLLVGRDAPGTRYYYGYGYGYGYRYNYYRYSDYLKADEQPAAKT